MNRIAIQLSSFILTCSLLDANHCQASDEEDFRTAIKGWGSSFTNDYKVDPYIRAAQVLQKMGKDEACTLLTACTSERDPGIPVGYLCRLVFKAKKGSSFRREAIGAVGFLGGSKYEDWPLDPFEIVDGVPFDITDGSHLIGGLPESEKKYLEYCMKKCEWNDIKFVPKSEKEKELALEKLLASRKWQKVLTTAESDRLRAQIK